MSNSPIPLWQVIKDEYENFHGGTPEVYAADISVLAKALKVAVLAKALKSPQSPWSEYLAGRPAEKASSALAEWDGEKPLPDELRDELIDLFYALLSDRELMKHADAEQLERAMERAGVKPRTLSELPTLQPGEVYLVNSYLLEEAYPGLTGRIDWTGKAPDGEEERRRWDAKRLRDIYPVVHQRRHSALCLSGGGIRSGTFALGVIQSLAQRGLLNQFDYLSTVSGGGYIGGWLTAWIHRHWRGLEGVVDELNGKTRTSPLEPEPEPLRHLREYSNFITPRSGLLSADTWTFIVIYIRNLLLNWIVLIPLLASVLMIPRVANAVVLAPPAWWVLAGLLVLGGFGVLLLRWSWKTAATLSVAIGLPLIFIAMSRAGWVSDGVFYVLRLISSLFNKVLEIRFFEFRELEVFYLFHQISPISWTDWLANRPWARWDAMSALLVGGALLSSYALAYMRANRPSNSGAIAPDSFWDKHRDQSSFLWLCLLPLTIASSALTTFWAWHRRLDGVPSSSGWEFLCFLIYGAGVGVLSSFLYFLIASSSWWKYKSKAVEPVALRTKIFKLKRQLNDYERKQRGLEAEARRELELQEARAKAELDAAEKRYEEVTKRSTATVASVSWHVLREIIVTLAASILGAILLWVAATKISLFAEPLPDAFTQYPAWIQVTLYTLLALPTYLFVFFLGITLFAGFTSRRSEKPPQQRRRGAAQGYMKSAWNWLSHPFDAAYVEDEDREWMARASAWIFIVIGGWVILGGLVIFGPLLYFVLGKWLAGIGGASGLVALLGGSSARTPGNKKEEAQQVWWKTLGVNMLVVAAFIFFSCIIIAISLLTGTLIAWLAQYLPAFPFGLLSPGWSLFGWSLDDAGRYFEIPPAYLNPFAGYYPFQSAENTFRVLHFPSWLYLLALALGLQVFGRIFARLINLNKFSLHAGYRDRIIRAFLGASRLKGERRGNLFTGFDPRDNLNMAELRLRLLRETDFEQPDGLTNFVNELNQPMAGLPPESVAAFLREEIEAMEGDSRKYFKDPPESIDTNPSFRTALFGDLNSILQRKDLPSSGGAQSPPPEDDSAPRIRRNRHLLNQAFKKCIKDPPPPYRLMHVVNMALNLVGGDRLAWQQRRAESFTSTPLHSGSFNVGYRRTCDYGGKNGITLGTAVAVSGAAASSNMGYFSPSVFVTFVLTFFNARLGWWLGNPDKHGNDTFFRSHPQNALSPIIDEAFGLTNDKNPYVLLSDGGHFENLGLYEMVLRRCRNIIVVDGSADPEGSYSDLAGAVRKIRIDFGIPIDFPSPFPILARPESETKRGAYVVVGDIHYEAVDDPEGEREESAGPGQRGRRNRLTGKLVYIKPTIYNTEPRDIFNYAKGDPTFPHESTADQFFDEPQFESHRMLGFHILESLFRSEEMTTPAPPDTIEQFVKRL